MSEIELLTGIDNLAAKLSPELQHEIVNNTATLWRTYTQRIRPILDQSQKAWRLYMGQSEKQNHNSVKIGHIARSVDSVHSFQHNTTFPSDERFFKGTALNDAARGYLDLYETWAALNMAEAGVMESFFNHRKRMFIDGTACLAINYRRKTKKEIRYEFPKMMVPGLQQERLQIPLTFLPPKETIVEDAVTWEGTQLESLELADWRIDPTAQSLEDTPFLRRWYEPVWRIQKQYPHLKKVDAYHQVIDSAKAANQQMTWSLSKNEIEGQEQALLIIHYGDFVLNGVVYENHAALILNDQTLLWFGPNPYHHGEKPYIVTPYNPVPGTLYGKSQIQDAIPSAHAVDKAVNQVLDIMSWAASPVFLKNLQDDAVKAQGDIVIEPGLHIPVTRSDAYQQLPINVSNIGVLLELIQVLESSIRETTGASPLFTGQDLESSPSGVTAFQVSAHLQGSNNRFQALMFFFNNSTLEPFMRMKWANDRQFMSQSYQVAGFEKKLTPNVLKQMQVSWNITANLATLHRNQELTNMKALIDMMPTLITNGLVVLKENQLELDHTVFLKRFFVKAGLPDIDEFLKVNQQENNMINDAV